MSRDNVIKKIKSKGYWEINIHPDVYNSQRIEKQKIKEIVRSAVVELSGRDYPHFRDSEGNPYSILNGIEKFVDFSNHIEFWRMTQSANFYQLLSLQEDWMKDVKYRNIWSDEDELKQKKWLGVLRTLYTLIEIFEFAKRLAFQGIFEDKVVIEIKLYDLRGRHLIVDSFDRVPFSFPRVALLNEPWTYHTKIFLVNELLNKLDQLVLDVFLDIIYLFQWENPPVELLKVIYKNFYKAKFNSCN